MLRTCDEESLKVGFLKISHKYEITFLLPATETLGLGACCVPLPSLYLKVVEISPVPEGHQLKCEYSAHKEGVIKEEMVITSEIKDNASVKVTFQARVLGIYRKDKAMEFTKNYINKNCQIINVQNKIDSMGLPCCWKVSSASAQNWSTTPSRVTGRVLISRHQDTMLPSASMVTTQMPH
ncbi:adipose-secreted signaling protein isoform X2 [Mobula birostris]|uniref:adipose-secreted signaling protein isoform X2 n=1 Tax=Mobula birostris TaxID=1983395 RepID=UPI003B27C51F